MLHFIDHSAFSFEYSLGKMGYRLYTLSGEMATSIGVAASIAALRAARMGCMGATKRNAPCLKEAFGYEN